MIHAKRLKVNQRTMSLVFSGREKDLCNLDKYKFVAISLLHGFYNPLRQYSTNDSPVTDYAKYSELREKYNDLINDLIHIMDVDVERIEKL